MATVIIPENLPVGYRFHPTDEELVDHYLKLKVLGFRDNICIIPEVDICKWEPWELAQRFKEQSIIPSDDKVQEWWFFCPKMPQVRRSTRLGFWKKTGVDRSIKARDNNREIGTRKLLVFHKGRSPKGIKTNWVVHEYHLLTDNLDELFPHNLTKNYVLCRLKLKGDDNSVISTIQSSGAISLIDSDSDLHQPEPENSFSVPWIQVVGNSPISMDDWDSDLHQPEPENSFSVPWISAMVNSPISMDDWDSDLHQPEPENSFSVPWISAMVNSPISMDDWDSDLHQPEHENSLAEPWIQVVRSSPISLVDLDSDLHQPEHENPLLRWIQAVGNSSREPSVQQDDQVQVTTSIFPQTSFQSENVDFGTNFQELIDIRSPSFAKFSLGNGDAFIDESDQLQFGYFDRDQMQTQYGPTRSSENELALMENRRTQIIESLHGVVPLDEKKGSIENKFNGLHISSPKHMEPPKKTEIARTYSTDEESLVEKVEKLELAARNIKLECVTLDELEAKAKVGESREHSAASKSPQNKHNKGIEQTTEKSNSVPNMRGTITNCTKLSTVPLLSGQTPSSRDDHATAESCLSATIEPLHSQTSTSQNKNAMLDTRRTRTIELLRGQGDVPLEKKKSFVGTESNTLNVLPQRRMEPQEKTVTVITSSKYEEPMFGKVKKLAARDIKQDCISLDDSADKAKLHIKHVLVGNPRDGTVEPLNGFVHLEKKKGLVENKSDSAHISSTKDMGLRERDAGVRIDWKDEPLRFEMLRKQDLAARNIKPEYVPLDESAAKAKHDQSNGAHLEGKKGFSENEFNGRQNVSAKQMEHPTKAVNAGIYCKPEEPRSEKVKKPELSARVISKPEGLPLVESAARSKSDRRKQRAQ
ncbi:uncharacterized protein LOC115746578 isoform X2 [Rhodamnia argentea]|uniref:Uncharacterized protein LOC115746578 isoform X2 n=1 Tax=Rhodamnia argentea TaxID=178133 RepID=A0ABM3HE10_9MYRT|nr:uncharacterized protein LOC115746578 isoform X2 [Rhodamnia argentea]